MKNTWAKWALGALACTTLTLSGYASKPAAATTTSTPNKPSTDYAEFSVNTTPNDDPLEKYNRAMFRFNSYIDFLVFRPLAQTYAALVPDKVQIGVTNIFLNVDEISTFPNDFLQGNFKYMAVDFWRFVINSTFGIGGIFDVATRWGIQPHVESFGLTLAKWRGGKSSTYFNIPVLGPATFQRAIGLGVDYFTTPWPYINDQTINYIATSIRLVSIRANILPSDKVIGTSFDPYVFVRDAYLQRENERIAANEALDKK